MGVHARLEMRRAGIADLATVRSILEEARAWLAERGSEQWADGFPDAMVRAPIEAGETWLCDVDGASAATITLQWSDPLIWPDAPDDAGYVHRLVVRRRATGLGAALLDWAAARTAARGRAYLRLDCWSGNAALRRYYEHAGFTHRGDRSEESWTVSRYERAV